MMLEHYGVTEETWRDATVGSPHFAAISETPRFVGRAVAALAADPDVQRRNGGSFSSGGLAREYGFTDVDGSQPDCWRYLVEVQDAGLPARPDRLPLSAPAMISAVRYMVIETYTSGPGPVYERAARAGGCCRRASSTSTAGWSTTAPSIAAFS